MKKLIFWVSLLFFCSYAESKSLNEVRTVSRIFSEAGNTAGFYTVEGLADCKWQIMRIDLATEAGRAMFSQVLTAKSAGFKIVRIDYSISADGTCKALGLHIE
ncbi:hypothetical protein tloyanaT_21830 [Thalassotalea loyana]|uniref:Uncharacterized protein n=1 Tax=Thalassotalea loyana TaxID=280483 RepID=A0ABQ6HCX0_9GAMM|nr:hypothetical protein [Thalassotalea loyana]GLX85931.1 hypothetical protein tloyanaT_21830 [Thalassotalea loyana]